MSAVRRLLFGLSCLTLAACASQSWKPTAAREPSPVLQRGWAYLEPESEVLGIESGFPPVSYSGPLVVGEKVVFGSERFGLMALAKRSGQELWRRPMADGVAAVPLVHEGKVFAGTETGLLHQLDLDSGRELWSVNLGAPVQGSMLFALGRLYVATADEALHALDPATGKSLWVYRRPSFSGTSIRGGGHPAIVAGQIWIGFSDGALVSLNPETGVLGVEKIFRDNLKFMDIDAKVIGWKDGLLVTTYDGKLRYLRRDGSLIWEFAAGGARAPIVTEGDFIFLPSSDGSVYGIRGSSGKEVWRYALRRGVPTGMALVEKGGARRLVVAGSDERLSVLDPEDGKLQGEISFGRGSGSYAPIAVDGDTGRFFVLSSFSRVYQFHLNL